ncbi:MAG: D-lyxose/D-mannose family sugar isomerase [Christensenella sp.]|nr:D-lyxose/D-mannose family sugar isomerase [Christensenella sp.]
MKRSQINQYVKQAIQLLDISNFKLPQFAYWTMREWQQHDRNVISKTMLGWDITDFGNNDFARLGAVLFTIRNGVSGLYGTPYAEKIICLRGGQRLPCHYHAVKTEDIINRSGGKLWIKLFNVAADGTPDLQREVEFYSDGIPMRAAAGEIVSIDHGCAITIPPYLYHIFGAENDTVVGEVSSINDDKTDNYFSEDVKRFSDIEEDEPPFVPLVNEYETLLA